MHPCLTCGACCASFRVDFSVHETEELGGCVPDGLVVPVTDHTARMRGTDHAQPRCAALTGQQADLQRRAFAADPQDLAPLLKLSPTPASVAGGCGRALSRRTRR